MSDTRPTEARRAPQVQPSPGGPGDPGVIDLRGHEGDRNGLAARPAASLSPSRAGDFMTCPLLYRYRSIERLPEPPGVEATRGTLVHAVLENLFDLAPTDRTPERAAELVAPQWSALVERDPHLPGLLFGPDDAWERWLAGEQSEPTDAASVERFLTDARGFVDRYFALEDPTRLQPAEREMSLSCELPSGLVLRGIIDRVDEAPTGEIRVVDYKTGRAPGPGWEAKALFQMRFYGLMVWRLRGRVPTRLQLLYLGSGERISVDPTEAELLATEAKVQALWEAISRATQSDHWPARPSRLCNWCSFQSRCPAFADAGATATQPLVPAT